MYKENFLQILLEKVLDRGYSLKNGEVAFFCPFCHHHKKKLQVNIETQRWHCWVCNTGGHTIYQLLKKLNAPQKLIKESLQVIGDYKSFSKDKEEVTEWSISLPECFHPMWERNDDFLYKHAMLYLQNRGISSRDIIRYGIGYCSDGVYENRIIIPSYDNNGKLNYFIARDMFPNSKMKYKNPPLSKDIIIFELFINWNKPIVLTEGVFDAITVKRNAIPLLGKFPSKELIKRIIKEHVEEIYIALDNDARIDTIKLTEFFNNFGIKAYIVDIQDKDPSALGFKNFWSIVKQTKAAKFSDIIRGKLYG